MTKIFHRIALMFGLLLAGPAFAAETTTLTHQGVTYAYKVTEKGAARIIEGVDSTNHQPFRLRVSRGWVEGRVGTTAVSFSLSEVKSVISPNTAVTTTSTMVATR